MTSTDDDAGIKIEYVQPKYEQNLDTDINHVNRTEIVIDIELRSTGVTFESEIDIDEKTKKFPLTNHHVPSHESPDELRDELRDELGDELGDELLDDHQSTLQSKFKCNLCSATFIRKDALIRHMELHATSKAYTCDCCSRSYSRSNCIRHLQAVLMKKEQKFYECYVCGIRYEKLGALKNHMILHFKGKTFQCKLCTEKFAYNTCLSRHVRKKHGKETQTKKKKKFQCDDSTFATVNKVHSRMISSNFSCKICEKIFPTSLQYRRHMRVHLKFIKCDSCPKAFCDQFSLNKHSIVHSSKPLPTCHICNRQLKRCTLKRHMRIHYSEKTFTCRICGKSFSLKHNLNKHLLQHVIGKKYQCYMCTFSSKRSEQLKLHFSKHIGKKNFKCKVCLKKFAQKDHWRRHVGKHIKGTFTCDYCSKTFSYAEILRLHLMRHTNSFECTVCSRVYNTRGDMMRHIRAVHNGEKTNKCEICSKMFFAKNNLRRHIRSLHRGDEPIENKYRCTVCTYATFCKDRLKAHSKWHNERTQACIECPKMFKTRSSLSRHIKGCHSKQPKIYTCKICSQTFHDVSSRREHIRVHTAKPIHKCSICSYVTTSKFTLLKRHMHVHTNTKPFQCNICLKKFSLKGSLNKHQKTHGLLANGLADSRIRYECYICGHFAKAGRHTLKIHFSKHTGEKLFKCNVCSRSFSRPDYLRLHLRLHTGEKPYKCGKCSRGFAQGSALRSHMAMHEKQAKKSSSERKYECFGCRFSTSNVKNLIEHSRSHGFNSISVVKLNKQANNFDPSSRRKYECFQCKFSTSEVKNLIEHSRRHGIEFKSVVKLNKLPKEQ